MKKSAPIKITFANIKGGVGKTTTLFQVAGLLSDRGYKILIIDCDPQGNVSNNLFGDNVPIGLNELLLNRANINDVIIQPYPNDETLKNISVITSSVDLFYIEDNDKDFIETFHNKLHILLAPIENNFDFILLDTNPSPNLTNSMAYCYTQYFIGILDTSIHSLRGFQYLESIINIIHDTVNPQSKILGILINNFDRRVNIDKSFSQVIKETYGELVFKTIISHLTINAESQAFNNPLIRYKNNHNATGQYIELITEILKRLKKEGRI
jgi:chromosome partitioning protein